MSPHPPDVESASPMARTAYNALVLILVAILAVVIWRIVTFDPVEQGMSENRNAWEASFTERGLPVEQNGPRDGYWSSRISTPVNHPLVGWHSSEVSLESMLDIDEHGYQYYISPDPSTVRILILGGSVAFGSYSSSEATSYFHVLGRSLDQQGVPSEITVFAAGAWKSIQELNALKLYASTRSFDVVVFVNGLNDLTNGAISASLFGQRKGLNGQPIPLPEGATWSHLYHAHDYDQRVRDYLSNMRTAYEVTKSLGAKMVFVLQPSLAERQHPTRIEKKLLEGALIPHASQEALVQSYALMRHHLKELAHAKDFSFVDASTLFDSEKPTMFADIWHFSDFGHTLLGEAIAEDLMPLLQATEASSETAPLE